MPSSQRAKFRHKMWIGQKANIEYEIGIVRQAVLITETHAGYEDRLLATGVLLEAVGQVGAQFMDIEFRSVNDQVSERANRLEMAAFSAQRCADRRTRSQRMRPAGLAKPPQQCGVARFQINYLRRNRMLHRLQ